MSKTKYIYSSEILSLNLNNIKCRKKKKIKIYYIPSGKFDEKGANIIGHTSFKHPDIGDDIFVYDNVPFLLTPEQKERNIQGYIPVSNNRYIAIDKKPKLFLLILFFFLFGLGLGMGLFLYLNPPEHKDKVTGGGYEFSEDDEIRQSHTASGNIFVSGYDYLSLKDGEYVPLQCSEKNTQCLQFVIMDESQNELYKSVVVAPGKEDRWYIKNLKKGDNKIIIKTYEVLDTEVLGNSVTHQMILNYY